MKIDLVISLEGDQISREVNPMVRPRGQRGRPRYGTYTIESRYGLWACRDYIPVQRVNDWIGGSQQVWIKYHAFVNCQDFELTANLGDFSNTPEDVLTAVQETVSHLFEDEVRKSREYLEADKYARQRATNRTQTGDRRDYIVLDAGRTQAQLFPV